MLSDSFFQQGVTHEVCEDYAIHGDGYAIVSDGCSNGGGPRIDTDFGARLLAKSAERHLRLPLAADNVPFQEIPWMLFLCELWSTAKQQQTSFTNLSPECLTATLGMIYRNGNNFCGMLIGDGVMGGRKRDGTYVYHVYEPIPGGERNAPAPFYLKYAMMEREFEIYKKMFGGKYRVTRHEINQNKNEKSESEIEITLENFIFQEVFPIKDFEWAFIATDGVGSFYQKTNSGTSKFNEPVSLIDVLGVLFHDISFRPGFLRLQRQWAFKRPLAGTFVKRNWHNGDDISIGIIQEGR